MDEKCKKTAAVSGSASGAARGRAAPSLMLRGVAVFREFLPLDDQGAMLDEIRAVIAAAPLFRPVTRWGRPMSTRMTSAGRWGWFSDRRGYRYVGTHPETGEPFPPIPPSVLAVWEQVTGLARQPDCCLVNFYDARARMGLHQDRDEADFTYPVVSISLGDSALFRVGNIERGGSTESLWLHSGDVLVMGGPARLVHHGIDRIRPSSSTLIEGGGRINLTLRVVK
jgi:alkylated DNA repair protein (DNA oxidative demethylase)